MGRIKKVAAERHTASLTTFVSTFVQEAAALPLHQLPAKLDTFPQPWQFPRGDLYHWIPLLDRFDHILEIFNKEYGLDQGAQQQPFECRLLLRGDAEEGMPTSPGGAKEQDLQASPFSAEGDRELVEAIVSFTKLLFEHCGNRSLYSSSSHIGNLLYTTSLSLLRVALRLGLRLAQRYQAAKYKSGPHSHANLLAQHYNVNLENLSKIAQAFPKPLQTPPVLSATPGKGKEKASHTAAYNPCDLVAVARDPESTAAKADAGSVHLTYYEQSTAPRPGSSHQHSEAAPATPTPTRRGSALGPSRERPGVERSVTSDTSATPVKSKENDSTQPSSLPKSFSITSTRVSETPSWALVREAISEVPKDSQYEALNRIRIAKAFTTLKESGQELVEARLLAIANLFYGAGESKFQEKVGIADSEEPKRLHLAHQLCELLQPPIKNQTALSLDCEIAVIYAVEAMSKMRHKAAEIADALQITQNHGVIYYELRKVITTMNAEAHEDRQLEAKESKWREATFDLTNSLLSAHTQPKQGQLMVSAGIMRILIEALTLRTARAERFHEKILLFFDSFIHGIQTAFQTLSNIKGFEILADLISYDVTSAMQRVQEGTGLAESQKSRVIDYAIPFHKQSTLRQLFKFVTHMYEHNAGTHDRILRNFIDTPQVLGGLRNVIEQGNIFGANVWTAAVSIVSNFIHNEPTSFQVVSEAGLVRSILQNISSISLDDAADSPAPGTKLLSDEGPAPLMYNEKGELQWPTASGILPVGEAMVEVPNAFGAVCLNENGMKLFRSSQALYFFMDIFVSRAHVTALEEDGSSASAIGQSFDELSRHHPSLKDEIVGVVVKMVQRVGEVCQYLAEREAVGSKLYERTADGISVAGGQQALAGQQVAEVPLENSASANPSHAADTQRVQSQQDDDRGKAMPFISACFKFLEGFFHNNSMCQMFCEHGGAIFLLDVVASASTPHDVTSFQVWSKFAPVFKTMVEQKPHLVLPSLVRRTQIAIAGLQPLLDSQNPEGAFSSFLDLSKPQVASLSGQDGTTVVKSLVMANLLTQILGRALAPPPYHRSHSPPSSIITQVNFTDIYIEMVDTLTQLHAACLWENLVLQRSLPEKWKGQTEPKPLMLRRINANGVVEIAHESRWDAQTSGNGGNNTANTNGSVPDEQAERLGIKNARTIRYLLNQTPHGIECFLHSLAQAIIPHRRNIAPTIKQEASVVAENLAKKLVWELDHRRFASADDVVVAKYTVSALTTCTRVLTKNSGADFGFTKEALSMVLNKFYLADGFRKLNEILDSFCNVLIKEGDDKDAALESSARDGLSIILNFFKEVVRHKCITEAFQSNAISVRDTKQADYFMPGQFVVEIRDIVLPAVNKLWHSIALEKIGVNHAKTTIEIMRIILKAEGEERAVKRSDNATRRVQATTFEVTWHDTGKDGRDETANALQTRGNDLALAREGAFRCNSVLAPAVEYCKFRREFERAPKFPVPDDKRPPPSSTETLKTMREQAGASDSAPALRRQQSVEMTDAGNDGSEAQTASSALRESSSDPDSSEDIDDDIPFRVGDISANIRGQDLLAMSGGNRRLQDILNLANGGSSSGPTTNPSAGLPAKDTHQPLVTVEDLDEKRRELRDDMLDRCLEILSAQKSITFELADLIHAAVAKSGDSANPRAEIGSTLVSSLLSLQGEEPSPESGAKISAYAHLIALILQDQDFFYSTLEELKECFGSLVEWIKLSVEQKIEDAPWVEMMLLIIERVLTEDEQPPEVVWTPPPADDPTKALPEIDRVEPIVDSFLKTDLFEAVVDLLPKIGKNPSLALSAARVLVILTRRRSFAAVRMSDRQCMSKLFVMIRQMAGSINEKLQGSFMLILRHMVEDEQIVRQIMQTEIRALFETHRTPRPMDTSTYARNLYHLVIRDPDLFVDVTKEMIEVARYDGNPNRGQTITLKKAKRAEVEDKPTESGDDATARPLVEERTALEDKKIPDVKQPPSEMSDIVIQYLLRELSNYRDVEDKPAVRKSVPHEKAQDIAPGEASGEATAESTDDVEMMDVAEPTPQPNSPDSQTEGSKLQKPTFKPEEHTIYIYRCFLMQCLSELLGSYNHTKMEFINFSRKAETHPATPVKPRSGTLNYLLNTLLPVGTLEQPDEIAHRKKISTSNWAATVLVSLCSRTPERQTPREIRVNTAKEDNADLTFVQKFVLEHALRSFKEATNSTEPLNQRYSRLLALAELFNRMLHSKVGRNDQMVQETTSGASRHIGKLMYEKNFVSAITSAIAEIDLNFPNAKRAVKYLLNPLKQLTDLGLYLSQDSDFSSSAIGTSEDDDISSATSVSDDDEHEGREQTPDLYRNSTLGMFEVSRNGRDDSDSESEDDEDDEDMYDDGYEEEMEYEEEQMAEHGDVVSDDEDDEEIEAMGDEMGDVEGVHGDPVDMDIEVVVDGEGDEMDSADDSEDSDDSEDDDDDEEGFGHDIDAMDEITGDDENASLADGHDEEGEWEEDDGDNFEFAADEGGSPHGGPLDEIARVIGVDDTSEPGDQQDVVDLADGDEEYFEDELPPEDGDEEEIESANDVHYEPEVEGLLQEFEDFVRRLTGRAEDEEDEPGTQWDFDAPPPPAAILRGHHHHHHRHGGLAEMFALGMGGPPRTHRSTSNSRGDDDGTNPLLQREGAARNQEYRDTGEISARITRRPGLPRPGEALIQDLVATLGPGGNGTIDISIDGFPGGRGNPFTNGMFAIRGGNGASLLDLDPARLRDHLPRFAEGYTRDNYGSRTTQVGDEAQAVSFRPMPSIVRWQEEAKMLFGGKHHEKASRIINALLRVLVPPAMEAKRKADLEEAQRKMQAEAKRQREEEERKAREEQEKKEREEREAKEAEEKRLREDAERQEAEARGESSMEGVEAPKDAEESQESVRQPHAGQSSAAAEESEAPRVTTTIRGRTLDITNLGVDLEYLEALPEELREEVIMTQFAEQRSQQAQSGEEPSEISREFLDALPPEIQRELIRSEAIDRRRRQRQEAERQAREQGGGQAAQPQEMNNADFMATLDPTLRQQILMDADEGDIAALPDEFQAEARVLGGDGRHRLGRLAQPGINAARGVPVTTARAEQEVREGSPQRRPIIQMLDKAGIATLLRLMFVSLHHRAKGNLHNILSDVCKNTQNRAEVISILLSILADGTADVHAVERSFASLSLRAKQQPAQPRTPTTTPLKRTATGTLITPGAELSPLNIVQQCLSTLNALTNDNPRVPTFFLTEHETISSQKAKSTKKGKANEVRAAKFPLNALLALLDRKLITENTGVMETLASLLSRVTHPLTMLLRRQKAAEEAEKRQAEEAEKKKSEGEEGETSRPPTAGGDVQMAEATTEAALATEPGPSASANELATVAGGDNAEATTGDNAKATDKKHREIVPPEVPQENLRSVVNIITARECPAKTFSDTLDLIKNLSNLPGAKEIFGRELVAQAQELSKAVLIELEDLARQINSATTGTDMQGLALTKFSSSASKQTKLLRVLLALDHLFDPQRTPEPPSSGEEMSSLKQDVLAALHDSATFDKLWANLSQCLTAIRNKGNMVNVAAILLPMIEALLVVCRNSTSLKDQPAEPGSPIATSPTTEAKLESLFFRFTEEHRKILNELIRNTPKLMHGNLAVLANNSKVLEFDNKRNYFNRQVHDRRHQQRGSYPSLQLNVRRDQVFLDSYKSLYYKTGDEIKYGKLNIRFHGEEGIDAGGVSREWFAAMARQIFNPDYALFVPVASDRTTFHPNEFSDVNQEHLRYFRFIGHVIGKALYEGRLLDCHFSRAVYRKILGKTVSLKDLESLELDHYKSLVWVLENDITDIITETFSIETDRFGAKQIVDLKEDGRNIEVTEENKQEWVRLIVEHKLIKSVEGQLKAFLDGFHEIIPAELISIFNEQELELLISGLPDIDVDDWKNNSEYHNYQSTSPQIQWFWRAVRSFDKEEKAKLLQFVTGTSKVPLNGFKELEGMNGFANFNVHRDYSSKEKLPSSHTCFNQLDLPEYESYEHLRQQLYTAITAGSEYFGFA